jgi:hypothetical protein
MESEQHSADYLELTKIMLGPEWAEIIINRLLVLDCIDFTQQLETEDTRLALSILSLSKEDLNKKYWRKICLPKLLDEFRSEVEGGNKAARIFVGRIVNLSNPLEAPDWLIKSWYNHDTGIVADKPKQGNAKLFEKRVRTATVYALIQRYRTKGFDVRNGTTQALVEEYLGSTSKVIVDRDFVQAIIGDTKDWPDTFIVMFAGLVNIDLGNLAKFLELKEDY